MLYLCQFLSSMTIDIGVAGVICLIEYGELGTFYGNLMSLIFYFSVIVSTEF